jgi:hypothetical protein
VDPGLRLFYSVSAGVMLRRRAMWMLVFFVAGIVALFGRRRVCDLVF